MTTNIDIALLGSEWHGHLCPCCGRSDLLEDEHGEALPPVHEPGCVHDLALAERGYLTQADRNAARKRIEDEGKRSERASAPTLIPPQPPEGS